MEKFSKNAAFILHSVYSERSSCEHVWFQLYSKVQRTKKNNERDIWWLWNKLHTRSRNTSIAQQQTRCYESIRTIHPSPTHTQTHHTPFQFMQIINFSRKTFLQTSFYYHDELSTEVPRWEWIASAKNSMLGHYGHTHAHTRRGLGLLDRAQERRQRRAKNKKNINFSAPIWFLE